MDNKTKNKNILKLKKDTCVQDTLSLRQYNIFIGLFIMFSFLIDVLIYPFIKNIFYNKNISVILIASFITTIIAVIFMSFSKNIIIILISYILLSIGIGIDISIGLVSYDLEEILLAIIGTIIVVSSMMIISCLKPNFFLSLGKTLVYCLLVSILVELIIIIFFKPLNPLINFITLIIFALFVGYDWQKSQNIPKTLKNAILSASELYLDIINIFLRLLEIFDRD